MRVARGTVVRGLGLTCVIVAALVLAMPLAAAPKPPGGGGPPADPAIAFLKGEAYPQDLMVMNADGSNAALVFRGSSRLGAPTWSPSGGSIAFFYQAGISAIDVAVVGGTPKGSNLRTIVASCVYPTGGECYPAWSPTGAEIAYSSGSDINVVPSSGGASTTLATSCSGGAAAQPTWSGDGSRLVFVAHYGQPCTSAVTGFHILMRATGLLEKSIPYSSLPFTHQYGSGMDWARTQDVLAVKGFTGSSSGIFTLNLVTEQLAFVTPGVFPTWSPNDGKIAFSTTGSPSHPEVKVLDLASGQVTRLARNGYTPDWRRF